MSPIRRYPLDVEDTVAGTTAGAGGADTEIVVVDYPQTGSTPAEAWSAEGAPQVVESTPPAELHPFQSGRGWVVAGAALAVAVLALGGALWVLLQPDGARTEPPPRPPVAIPALALPTTTTFPDRLTDASDLQQVLLYAESARLARGEATTAVGAPA